MIKVYCYGIFADTMTDEEFYEVEKNQRECHAAWAENFSAVSELLEMNPVIDNLSMDNKTDEYIVWLVEMMDDSNILFTTSRRGRRLPSRRSARCSKTCIPRMKWRS